MRRHMADSSYVDFGRFLNVYGNAIINVQNSFFLHMIVILPPGLISHMVRCFRWLFCMFRTGFSFYGRLWPISERVRNVYNF